MGRRIERVTPATYDDVVAAPDDVVAELIDGVLYLSPRPGGVHARAEFALGGALEGPFRRGRGGPGGWVFLIEPELHFPPDRPKPLRALVPDVAGWRRERLPVVPDGHPQVAPDWVCEIRSDSTAVFDRKAKLPRYAEWNVRHVWIADPKGIALEILRLEGAEYASVGLFGEDDGPVRAEPFEAVSFDLFELLGLDR